MSEQLMHLLLVGLRPTMQAPLEQFSHNCGGAIVVAEDLANAYLIVGEHTRSYQHAVIDLTGVPANSNADRSASDLVARLREQTPTLQWIAITEPTLDARLAALRSGAYQALSEPFHPEELTIALERIQQLNQVQRHAEQLEQIRQTTLAITSQRGRKTLLPMIVEHAVSLLRAKSGGIYERRAGPRPGTACATRPGCGVSWPAGNLIDVQARLLQQPGLHVRVCGQQSRSAKIAPACYTIPFGTRYQYALLNSVFS